MPSNMETRRQHLRELVEEESPLELYQDEAAAALEGGDVPRYAMSTSEGSGESSYRENPNITVHDTLEGLLSCASSEAGDGWIPNSIVDLETGRGLNYDVRVVIREEPGRNLTDHERALVRAHGFQG